MIFSAYSRSHTKDRIEAFIRTLFVNECALDSFVGGAKARV